MDTISAWLGTSSQKNLIIKARIRTVISAVVRAKVLMEVSYGFDNNVVAEHYNVITVIEVIKNDSLQIMNLSFFDEE
ncbi:hypothetical protein [Desulfosporosinus nitroreducens]|uniref:Uncharacterized protein n=1 Tax=Desulfosporosinus nitroreducens TaxID=2018668 RepID=A0ABT8QY17_9FIRM|nr:hypothetical protein [Desulfosporosinus nitroreducens]MDO0826060.1 hypothetical protein [Desulfosporosinus nitroreducens]